MGRQPFVPSRSSRHRTAALALYRALLRAVDRNQQFTNGPSRQYVRQAIASRFRANSPYTSVRLVYAAMTAGYKYLSVLQSSPCPNSPNISSPLSHLLERLSIADKPGPSAPSNRTNDTAVQAEQYQKPLIFNVASPGQPPQYISERFPRPAEELNSLRDVPSLCATSLGMPFIRVKKPQARALSRMVGRNVRTFEHRVGKILEADEDLVPEAVLEDQWDAMMSDLQVRQGQPVQEDDEDIESQYTWSAQLTRLWWEFRAEQMWQDWVARGAALNDIVEAEKKLVSQKLSTMAIRQGDAPPPLRRKGASKKDPFAAVGPPLKPASPPKRSQNTRNRDVKVSPGLPMRLVTKWARINDQLGPAELHCNVDTFSSPSWAELMRAEKARMIKWTTMSVGARAQNSEIRVK